MLALKPAWRALSVLLASLAARRWGHGVAGTLSGFPVIAAPITLFVLGWQQHEVRTRETRWPRSCACRPPSCTS